MDPSTTSEGLACIVRSRSVEKNVHPVAAPHAYRLSRQEFSDGDETTPTADEIRRAVLKSYFDLRAEIWWMNSISLILVGCCAYFGNPPELIWWLIGCQVAVSIFSHVVLDRPVLNEDNSIRGERSVPLMVGVLFVEGGLWGLMMLPFTPTLGSDVASTFVCTILIATICIACTLNALRPLRIAAYFSGFFVALFPQCIAFYDIVGPLPLLSTIVLVPAVISLAHAVNHQSMRSLITQIENRKLSERLAESLRLTSYLAKRDALTGLLNRRAFEEAASEFAGAGAAASELAIILVDLDHFKFINDTFGHATGDEVLKKTAACLTAGIGAAGVVGRGDAAVARWGGEEFIVLLPDTGPHQAYEVAQKLRERLANMTASTGTLSLQITASFGVSFTKSPRPLTELLATADDALYQAKREGRNLVRVQLFDAA